ncbi:MAG TPA: response regulator transcription factor [Opitutaceae bacterium]|jgi:DNA-binding NarL/FixJ family response regulator
MTTVLIADDHEIVRRGVRDLLESDGSFRILGDFSDGLSAAQAAEKLKPDILIMDLHMPRLGGLEVLKQVRVSSPKTRVIVLTMHSDEPYVIEALRSGAAAYVLKGSEAAEITNALREVLAGRRYLSSPLSEWAIRVLTDRGGDESDPLSRLSRREMEVLQLAVEGLSAGEIAEKLFISARTCETHRANLMAKLGLQTQTELVKFAIRKGLIQP